MNTGKALVTLIDERTEKQHVPAAVLRRSWYQKLLRVFPRCVQDVILVPLTVVYVEPERIRALNAKYRGISRVTDVLSFGYTASGGRLTEGEIVICPEQALCQRTRFRTTVEQEFARLFFHGILHVYGYEHAKRPEQKIMRSIEQRLMQYYEKTPAV